MSKNKKAIIYVRVGSSHISNKNLSITNQEKSCKDYALKNNYDVVEVISDYGKSSSKSFLQLIKKVLKNKKKIDLLIGYQFDRFSRNPVDFHYFSYLLQDNGIDIAIASSDTIVTPFGIEPRLPGNNLVRNMLLSIAQYDNQMKSKRVRDCMRAKFEQGYWLWQSPFGYEKSKKGDPLVVQVDEAKIVKDIFNEAGKKLPNFESLSKKHSLSKSKIQKIISNPFYKGEMYSNTCELTVKGRHQPLVDKQTWEGVQI